MNMKDARLAERLARTGWVYNGRNWLDLAWGDEAYAVWLVRAEFYIVTWIGVVKNTEDIDDWCWADAYEDGVSPRMAAIGALKGGRLRHRGVLTASVGPSGGRPWRPGPTWSSSRKGTVMNKARLRWAPRLTDNARKYGVAQAQRDLLLGVDPQIILERLTVGWVGGGPSGSPVSDPRRVGDHYLEGRGA